MLDKAVIADYISELAKKYDTVGTERTFSTYDNQEITVSGGNYGWVIDQEKETDALYQDIMDKKTEVRELFMNRKRRAVIQMISDIPI